MKKIVTLKLFLTTLIVYSFSPVLYALDGVIELNQTCAVQQGGCFSGDYTGYPIYIDGKAGSSYKLTSNLIIPNENTHAVYIIASGISIDLNGFEIQQLGCTGTKSDCIPNKGTGSGIASGKSSLIGLSVKNGSIVGMGRYAIYWAGSQAEIKGLRVRWNRFDGIKVGKGSVVQDSLAYGNGQDGIVAGTGSVIQGNSAYNNGKRGILAHTGSTVISNAAFNNQLEGLFADSASTVRNNTSYQNGSHGIFSNYGSTISDNTAYENGGDGIRTQKGCQVSRNTVRRNSGFGLSLNSSATYRENVITDNFAGTVKSGYNMGNNFCETNSVCP